MKAMCPYCEKTTEIKIKKAKEEYDVKGVKVPVNAEYSECTVCGNTFATAQQMDKSVQQGFDNYRNKEDIVSPAEIISIREKYNASQKVFAKILDLGELTINTYEQGALVSKSISNLIRLMDDPQNFRELFEKNIKQLSDNQINKIQTALNEIDNFYSIQSLIKIKDTDDKYTGHSRPDLNKLFGLIQLIIAFAGKSLYKMAVLKILFYIDFVSYKIRNYSITGWPYARLPYGPVPDEYKTVLNVGQEHLFFTPEPDESEMGELFELPEYFKLKNVEGKFDKKSLEIIEMVVSSLKDKSPTQLKDLTHKETGWKQTKNAKLIDYKYAEELLAF
ncbi:MAG: DUF4065 domain-containing protein [Spirochaetales bacterium]|nr:DUF4065 domain-containing protein [Spirochaetales bacterium]